MGRTVNPLRARLRAIAAAADRVDAHAERQRTAPRESERAAALARLPSPARRADPETEAQVAAVTPADLGALADRLRRAALALAEALGGEAAVARLARDDEDARLVAAGARRCFACGRVRPLGWFPAPIGEGQRRRCAACIWRPQET